MNDTERCHLDPHRPEDAEFDDVHGYGLANGAFFTDEQADDGILVALIGSDVAIQVFGDVDTVNRTLRVSFLDGRTTFELVVGGVFDELGGNADVNGQVIVPIQSVLSRLRFLNTANGIGLNQIDIRTTPHADQDQMKEQIAAVFDFIGEIRRRSSSAPRTN